VPLADADVTAVGRHVDWYQDWLAHDEPADPWWTPVDFGRTLERTPPMSMVAGWYDLFLPYQLADYKKLRAAGRPTRLLVGPWRHAQPQTVAGFLRDTVEWADVHLRATASARATDVRVFLMGAEKWIDLAEWPPPSTPTRYHLHAGGGLGTETPAASAPDRYRYDPADPTPSVGGASLSRKAGARDNRKREARHDVLTYTTPPLPHDVTVIGEVGAELFVRSSLDHTDFVVRLCDVAPDGKSLNISDGVVRLRPGDVQRQPDGALKLVIPMFPTGVTFGRGHRIRLQVSSGAHPLFVRNPGSGEPLGKATTFIAADQEVLHDPDHPSAVVLPMSDARLTA
jgi:putative CocE/NonD family hydrolase